MKMFWGMILEPGKKYEHKSESSFHLTMAALEPSTKQPAPNKSTITSVLLESAKSQYILCNLDQSKVLQQPLDCVFMEGEDVTFSVNGEGKVHLTGYIMPDSDLEDMYDMDSDEEDSEEEVAVAINDKKRKQVTQDVKSAGKKVKLGGDEPVKKEEKKQPGKPIKVGPTIKGSLKDDDDEDDDEDEDDEDDMDSEDMADLLDNFNDDEDDEDDDDEDEDDDEEGDSSPEIKKGPKQPQAQIKTPNQKGTPGKGQQQQQKSPGQQQTPPQKKPFQQGNKQQWSHGKNQNPKFNKNQNSGRKGTPQSNNKFGGSPGNKNKKPWMKK